MLGLTGPELTTTQIEMAVARHHTLLDRVPNEARQFVYDMKQRDLTSLIVVTETHGYGARCLVEYERSDKQKKPVLHSHEF